MAEKHVTLPAPQLDAVRNGATMLVQRMEPQPEFSGGMWLWCAETDAQPAWYAYDELCEMCPFGRPGDVLVVPCGLEYRGLTLPPTTNVMRLPVVSVAVQRSGRINRDQIQRCMSPDFNPWTHECWGLWNSFYDRYNPDHPWNAEDWVWVAEVTEEQPDAA